eukprot:2013802-Rhodomonas_salina.1
MDGELVLKKQAQRIDEVECKIKSFNSQMKAGVLEMKDQVRDLFQTLNKLKGSGCGVEEREVASFSSGPSDKAKLDALEKFVLSKCTQLHNELDASRKRFGVLMGEIRGEDEYARTNIEGVCK